MRLLTGADSAEINILVSCGTVLRALLTNAPPAVQVPPFQWQPSVFVEHICVETSANAIIRKVDGSLNFQVHGVHPSYGM